MGWLPRPLDRSRPRRSLKAQMHQSNLGHMFLIEATSSKPNNRVGTSILYEFVLLQALKPHKLPQATRGRFENEEASVGLHFACFLAGVATPMPCQALALADSWIIGL